MDDDKYKFFNPDGVAYCKNRIDTLVTVNQEIDTLHKVTKTYIPPKNDAAAIVVTMYASDKEIVKYIDEPGVLKLGELTIPTPNPEGKNINERDIFVDVLFGKTEIQAELRYAITGKSISAVFKYLD